MDMKNIIKLYSPLDYSKKGEAAEKLTLEEFLRETSLKPGIINPILEANESSLVDQAYRAAQILTRPNITLDKLSEIDFIKEKTLVKSDAEMKQLFTLVNKTIAPNEFPEKFYEIQRDSLLMYVQGDTLKNGDCIFGIKQNEWVTCENN